MTKKVMDVVPWVLVIFNEETDEVQVRGPWDIQRDANRAARAFSRRLKRENDPTPYRLAVVGVTPMVYFEANVE